MLCQLNLFYHLACLTNMLKKTPTTDDFVYNMRMTIQIINGVRRCDTIKNSLRCSTEKTVLSWKNIFHLTSF